MLHLLLFLLALYASPALAEYVYPVAAVSEEQVYVLYQKSVDHIELWLWNSITKKGVKSVAFNVFSCGVTIAS